MIIHDPSVIDSCKYVRTYHNLKRHFFSPWHIPAACVDTSCLFMQWNTCGVIGPQTAGLEQTCKPHDKGTWKQCGGVFVVCGEVLEWIRYFIPHLIMGVIVYPYRDLSWSLLVKGAHRYNVWYDIMVISAATPLRGDFSQYLIFHRH